MKYQWNNLGNYIMFFTFKKRDLAIDATDSTIKRFSRLINHSKKNANIKPKIIPLLNDETGKIEVFVSFFAIQEIEIDQPLYFDYGDRRLSVRRDFEWINN